MNAIVVDIGVRSLALCVLGGLALLATKRCSASVRHAVVIVTLASLFGLPLAYLALPHKVLPVLRSNVVVSYGPISPVTTPITTDSAPESREPATQQPVEWLGWAWAIGAALGTLRLGVGLSIASRRAQAAAPTDMPNVRTDPHTAVPMTVWAGRPIVLLPPDWSDWPSQRLESVLLHERAHIRRFDWWTHLLASLTCILLWPNPLVWLLRKVSRNLAEEAADDLVLSAGVPPASYAQELLNIARYAQATGLAVGLPMAQKTDVARRIEMLFDHRKPRRPVRRSAVLSLLAASIAAGLPLATWALGPQQPLRRSATASSSGNPAQYFLDCQIWQGPGKPGKPKTTLMVSDSVVPADSTLKLLSAPKIRTISGMKATITIDDDKGDGYTLSMTPTTKRAHDVSVVANLTLGKGTKPALSGRTTLHEGQWLCLMSGKKSKTGVLYFAVHVVRVAEGSP